MRSTRLLALGAVVLGGVALAGCGPTKSATSAAPEAKDVLTVMRTDAKGTIEKLASTAAKPSSVTVDMNGTVDGKQTKSHGVFTLGGPLRAEMVSEDADGPSTVRMFDDAFYVKLKDDQKASLGGKNWMRMDMKKGDAAGEQQTRQFDDVDPAKQLRVLQASGAIAVVGEEQVAGVRAVHYSGTAPLAAYLGKLDDKSRDAVQKKLSGKGVTEVRSDLWIDETYRLRRSHLVIGGTDLTTDFTDYDKPVTVEVPPASDMVDMDEILSKIN
jgi:hypothetical protein